MLAEKVKSVAARADPYKYSRVLYIVEAMLEYFISIAVGTVYLARITAYIGIPDSLTGILSSFVSLGCGFQLVAIFLANKRPVKRWVTALHMVSQTLFALIYFVPGCKLSVTAKTAIFVVLLLCAQILHNIINSPKINWYMSLVDNGKRGRFTANKEIVSLLGGIVFSFGLGNLIDYYIGNGNLSTAFTVCGIGLFVLMMLHSLTLLLSKEKPPSDAEKTPIGRSVKALLKNKTLFKIILVSVLWSVANYATLSFSGSYQAKELAFSTTFSSILIMAGSLIRALFSRPMGKFADKHSFVNLLFVCFSVAAVGYAVNMFTVPSNGKIFYAIYYILYCIGMAGINSATINLVYDYVEDELRTSALALKHTCAGLAGFFTTLALSPLLSLIQKNGNSFLGIPLYAQQLLSAFSLSVIAALLIYMFTVVRKIPRKGTCAETENSAKEENGENVMQPTISEDSG